MQLMKKLVIALTALVLASTAKAQNLSLGPTIGFGHSWITDFGGDAAFHPSFNFGGSLVYSSNAHWGFGIDLKFSREGGKIQNVYVLDSFIDDKRTINNDYLRVPLKVIYFFNEYGNPVRPKISLGPTFGFLVGGKTTYETGSISHVTDTKNYFKNFDLGLQGSAGINFRLAKNTWLNTDLSYYQGLMDVIKTNTGEASHNGNIGVNVGLTFGIGTVTSK